MVTMRLSCTVMEIWGHEIDLLGSRDVIGHVTIRLTGVDFLSVVHGDRASI